MKHTLTEKVLAVSIGLMLTLSFGLADEHEERVDIELMEEPPEVELPQPDRLPGDALYGLERTKESIELGVARAPVIGGPEREAMVRTNHADKRLAEAQALIDRNDTERAQQAVERFERGMERANERAQRANSTELDQRMEEASNRQLQALEQVRERVPEEAQEGIQNAIENSQRVRDSISERRGPPADAGPEGREPGPPQDVGPGQEPENQENNTGQEEGNETVEQENEADEAQEQQPENQSNQGQQPQ